MTTSNQTQATIATLLNKFNLESNNNVLALYEDAIDRIYDETTDDNVLTVAKEGFNQDVLERFIEQNQENSL